MILLKGRDPVLMLRSGPCSVHLDYSRWSRSEDYPPHRLSFWPPCVGTRILSKCRECTVKEAITNQSFGGQKKTQTAFCCLLVPSTAFGLPGPCESSNLSSCNVRRSTVLPKPSSQCLPPTAACPTGCVGYNILFSRTRFKNTAWSLFHFSISISFTHKPSPIH